MKYLNALSLTLVLLLSVSFMATAQVDRSKAPTPGPAPKIKMGKYKKFTLDNGLQVIVVENHKRPRVSFQLALDVDPMVEGEFAGISSMAGDLMQSGTTNRTKAQIDEDIDFMGASLNTSSSGIYASSLTKHTDKLLELMTDVMYNPTFPEEELEKLKKQTISGLASSRNEPSVIAENVGNALRFGLDHPYGEQITAETVERATVAKCKELYNTYFKPNVSYLIIVGDIKASVAKKKAEQYFGKWKRGDVPEHKFEVPQAPSKTRVAFVHKPGAVQSVIHVTYPVSLKPNSADLMSARVMNNILGGGSFSGRLMQNLREDKAYTYGARSRLSSDRLVGEFRAFASVRNEVTDSSVVEFLKEMTTIRENQVAADELSMTKNVMNGGFARSLESPETIAGFALNLAVNELPADYYDTYLERLSQVTVEGVQAAAKKYITPENATILVVGNKEEVAEKLARFSGAGEVEYFDIYGNVYTGEALAPVPAGVTAQSVVEGYLKALGGREKIGAVKDLEIESSASMQGVELLMVTKQKASGKFARQMSGMGMVFQKTVFDGTKGYEESRGQRADFDEAMVKEMKLNSTFILEMKYTELGFGLDLKGIEELKSGPAYKLEVEDPMGKKETCYYDVASGLKVRTVSMEETPMGPLEAIEIYEQYKAVDGVLFPHKNTQVVGAQEISFETKKITLNTGMDDAAFLVE